MTNLRPLIIDDAARVQIKRVIDHAKKNPWHPGEPPPGNYSDFVTYLNTYRVVFTFTHAEGKIYRHLTVSVPSEKYPNPAAALLIAHEFGFVGWDEKNLEDLPEGWIMHVSEEEHCVVLAQVCGHVN